jgi:hypothetical protein
VGVRRRRRCPSAEYCAQIAVVCALTWILRTLACRAPGREREDKQHQGAESALDANAHSVIA